MVQLLSSRRLFPVLSRTKLFAAPFSAEAKSKVHGSYHWNFERMLSVATIPLTISAFTLGPVPLVDFALGVVLPLHCHLGFQCIVEDYVPARRAKISNFILGWSVFAATLASMYGCFIFNTQDVGITQFCINLWKGPEKKAKA